MRRSTLERLRGEQTAHDRFEQAHGWRRTQLAELRARLDHHWVEVIAGCVQADDPLAYGIDRLRGARRTVAGDLDAIDASIPDDREGEQAQTRRELIAATNKTRTPNGDLAVARSAADQAGRRRWGTT